MASDLTRYENHLLDYFNTLQKESFEEAHCIFCSAGAESVRLFTKGTMDVHRCQCGLVWNKNQPTQSALDAFYKESGAMTIWSRIKETEHEQKRQEEKFGKAIETLIERDVKTVLDVGCGNGKFLSLLKEKAPRINSHGIDTNKMAIEIAGKAGLHVEVATLEDFFEPPVGFHCPPLYDAITLWGVLEHVKEPIVLLKKCLSLLEPGGCLVLCVPNVSSAVVQALWEKCFTFQPTHLWYFNAITLSESLRRAGLDYLLGHWTIEPEALPIRKALDGFHPYFPLPEWAKNSPTFSKANLQEYEEKILTSQTGYKIVAIALKDESIEPHRDYPS